MGRWRPKIPQSEARSHSLPSLTTFFCDAPKEARLRVCGDGAGVVAQTSRANRGPKVLREDASDGSGRRSRVSSRSSPATVASQGEQNDVAEIVLLAERRLGRDIAAMTANQSSRWQAEARVPDDEFQEFIVDTLRRRRAAPDLGHQRPPRGLSCDDTTEWTKQSSPRPGRIPGA